MADYKGIKGFKVQYLSADPSDPNIGQIWYNSTSKALKFTEYQAAAWASGGTAGTARYATAGVGLQTAAVAFGGSTYGGSPGVQVANTEEYDGSTWSPSGNMGTARYRFSGFGTQTSAVGVGGVQNSGPGTTSVEHYNGSTWTGGTAYPLATQFQTSVGTLTAGLVWGGRNPPGGPNSNVTNEYDGATWTAGGLFPNGMSLSGGAGTQTAAINCAGENTSGPTNATHFYDGTSWSVQGGTIPTNSTGHQLVGTQTAAVASSVSPPTANTQVWDGTSWTASANMSTPRILSAPAGTATAALVSIGGTFNNYTAATEEYTGAGPVTKTVTVS